MSLLLENAIPSLSVSTKSASWPSPYSTYAYPAPDSSPAPMSPQSFHSYLSRIPESSVPSQEINTLPASGWYGPSISAPEDQSETSYASYRQYMPPHTASINFSPATSTFGYPGKITASTSQLDRVVVANSPSSMYSGDSVAPDSTRLSEEPHHNSSAAVQQSTARLKAQSHMTEQHHSNSSSMNRAPIEVPWTMNPLGIHSSHDSYYPTFPISTHSPRLAEPLIELPSNHLTSPHSRRVYTPIAPLPLDPPRSHRLKRPREEDEEALDDSKRRKRSDSNTSTQFELSDEDKLLLQLKEEESMPWKEIAARFQSDLGKAYQIPALQMRLKRLRERMRVWTETDVKALRMAHEYWVQNKFDIIAQKMLEFGAQEKWTARQCARKWTADTEPTPYVHFEHHAHQGFAPYSMSPVEPPATYLPFLHAQ